GLWGQSFIQDTVHLFGNGHLNAEPARERIQLARRGDAFRFLANFLQHFLELTPLAQTETHATIARHVVGTRKNKIAGAGQTHKRLRLAAQRHSEPRELGQAARHEGGARVGAETKPVAYARRDGDNVLYRTAELHAGQIVAGVNTHAVVAQPGSNVLGHGGMPGRYGESRGQSLG